MTNRRPTTNDRSHFLENSKWQYFSKVKSFQKGFFWEQRVYQLLPATGDLIYFLFGSQLWFSGLADRMILVGVFGVGCHNAREVD